MGRKECLLHRLITKVGQTFLSVRSQEVRRARPWIASQLCFPTAKRRQPVAWGVSRRNNHPEVGSREAATGEPTQRERSPSRPSRNRCFLSPLRGFKTNYFIATPTAFNSIGAIDIHDSCTCPYGALNCTPTRIPFVSVETYRRTSHSHVLMCWHANLGRSFDGGSDSTLLPGDFCSCGGDLAHGSADLRSG